MGLTVEDIHSSSELRQTIAETLYGCSQSKYNPKAHFLTMMLLLDQDFSKHEIHQKLLSLLVDDMKNWKWFYEDEQTKIQLLAQHQLWLKMQAFLMRHQQSHGLDVCEQNWLSYMDGFSWREQMRSFMVSSNSALVETIELSKKQKERIRLRFLASI